MVLRRLQRRTEADALVKEALTLDPLDWWARHLSGEPLGCDAQTALDIAHDYARAGFYAEAIDLLSDFLLRHSHSTFYLASRESGSPKAEQKHCLPTQSLGALPLTYYTLGWLQKKVGNTKSATKHFRKAATLPADYCFPSRLEEIAILESAMRANPGDARAPYYLGNLLYDRRRHNEAIQLWEKSAALDQRFPIVLRNLGIGDFNIHRNARKARAAYERAFQLNPADARLLYERDQLWKRLGEKPSRRLSEMEKHLDLVERRDDLSVELCALYNQTVNTTKHYRFCDNGPFSRGKAAKAGPSASGCGRTWASDDVCWVQAMRSMRAIISIGACCTRESRRGKTPARQSK